MPDKPTGAAMRAAAKYHEEGPRPGLAIIIDAEFSELVEAAEGVVSEIDVYDSPEQEEVCERLERALHALKGA